MTASRVARDRAGVARAASESGVAITYANEWPSSAVFERGRIGKENGGTAAAGLRTVSKGSSRGAGPLKKQGRVTRRGGSADDVPLCAHGQRQAKCGRCSALHCGCPGSLAHVCSEE